MKKQAITLLLGCFMLLLSGIQAQSEQPQPAQPKTAPAQPVSGSRKFAVSPNEMKLRSTLRGLLIQCLNKQRALAVKTLTGAQDVQKAQDNLTAAVNNLGGVFKTYYGDSGSGQITTLFGQYIQLTASYADAVKKGTDGASASSSMLNKADEIERFFSSTSPIWAKGRLSKALGKYAECSMKEIDMEKQSIGKPDEKVFEATFRQCAELTDILAMGIARQFPKQFLK